MQEAHAINFAKMHKLVLRYLIYKKIITLRRTDTIEYIISRRSKAGIYTHVKKR